MEPGNAINGTLPGSVRIASAIGEIKHAGYDLFGALEETIGFDERGNADESPGAAARRSGATGASAELH